MPAEQPHSAILCVVVGQCAKPHCAIRGLVAEKIGLQSSGHVKRPVEHTTTANIIRWLLTIWPWVNPWVCYWHVQRHNEDTTVLYPINSTQRSGVDAWCPCSRVPTHALRVLGTSAPGSKHVDVGQANFPDFWPFGNQSVSDVQNYSSSCFFLLTCQYPVSICKHRAVSF